MARSCRRCVRCGGGGVGRGADPDRHAGAPRGAGGREGFGCECAGGACPLWAWQPALPIRDFLSTQTLCKPHSSRSAIHAAPQVADLIAAGKVKLEVALSVPLAEAAKAHDQVQTGHTRGKVVLTV